MNDSTKRETAVSMLRQRAAELGAIPKRSDFSGSEVCFIKQKLGPWPRALEAAGLKAPPAVSAAEKSRLKRERARKRRKAEKMLSGSDNDRQIKAGNKPEVSE